jgi:hypothetical protein
MISLITEAYHNSDVYSSKSPTLFQLAVAAAAAVHHNGPRYWPFRRQCYWFADVLLQVLARTYRTPNSNDRKFSEDIYDEVQVPDAWMEKYSEE